MTSVSFIVQFLVSLVGLGVAIDYSLLLVTRWREERRARIIHEDALVKAMQTAGRAVLLSGLTVAIGTDVTHRVAGTLLAQYGHRGDVDSARFGAVVLTLLPAILASVGPRWTGPDYETKGRRVGVGSVGERNHQTSVVGFSRSVTYSWDRHLPGAALRVVKPLLRRSAEWSGPPFVPGTAVGRSIRRRHYADGSSGRRTVREFDDAHVA